MSPSPMTLTLLRQLDAHAEPRRTYAVRVEVVLSSDPGGSVNFSEAFRIPNVSLETLVKVIEHYRISCDGFRNLDGAAYEALMAAREEKEAKARSEVEAQVEAMALETREDWDGGE